MREIDFGVWEIEVIDGLESLHRETVPGHRLTFEGAKTLVKALAVKYEPLTFRETVFSLLNKRRGGPFNGPVFDAEYFMDPDSERAGFQIFAPTITVFARFRLKKEACEFVRENRRRNDT